MSPLDCNTTSCAGRHADSLDCWGTGEADLRKLDSSVKRNTATLNKLRKLSDETGSALLEDLKRVNQAKVCHEHRCARDPKLPLT